jgi:uncharacterized protein with PhoU and TrkA domain
MIFNPPPETTIEVGDILLAIGHREQLDELDRLAGAASGREPGGS